jgi:polyisoprenoid-binding protein YceI
MSRLSTNLKRFRSELLLGVVCALAVGAAYGQQLTVELDPNHTTVAWTLGATLHTVHGTFNVKSGKVQFDPASGAASGMIVVDATSGESGNSSRDSNMHKDVIESRTYPEVTFAVQKVVGTFVAQRSSNVQVQGVLGVHGAEHPLTIPVELTGKGTDLTAKTHFDVPFVEWGMKDPSTFLLKVKKVVHIEISAVGNLAPANRP